MAQQGLVSRRSPSGGRQERRAPSRTAVPPDHAGFESDFDGLELIALPDIGRSAPGALSRSGIVQLQRCHGNRFVQRLIAGPPVVQRCGGVIHAGCACAEHGGHAPDEDERVLQPAAPVVAPLRLQRLTDAEKAQDLKSSRYAGNPRLESAFDNAPPMKQGEKGEAVKAVQQGLIDDGFPMPVSTKKTGAPDGDYGGETIAAVRKFQKKHGLLTNGLPDGIVGRQTLGKLDELGGGAPPDKRVGPQTSDFEMKGKSRFADGATKAIFFEKDSAAFIDDKERTKAAALAKPADEALTLHGVASEDEAPALATARIATVAAELTKGGHNVAKVTPNPDPAAGKGDIDYRGARRVEIVKAGAKPAGPKCEDDQGKKLPAQEPCDAATETALTAALTQANTLLDGAISALSAKPPKAETLTAMDVTFGANVAGAGKKQTALVLLQLGRIKSQLKNTAKAEGHNCGNLCDASCSSGSGAYNVGAGGKAKMTLCPGFKDIKGNLPALILIHEASHGTAGLETQDFAYAAERAIDFLSPAQAVRNADSYVNICMRINTGATLDTPPADTLVGMDADPTAQDAAKRSLARVEKLVQFSSQDVASLFDALKKAQENGSWFHKDVPGFGPPLMTIVAPRFALTPVVKPPTNRDRFAVAAIADRYKQMIGSLFGVPHTITRDPAKPTAWEAGPGANVAVGADFFAATPDKRIDLLLAELAKATPGISAGIVPQYVALTHDIENLFHR